MIRLNKWRSIVAIILALISITTCFFGYSDDVLAVEENTGIVSITDDTNIEKYSTGGLYAPSDRVEKAQNSISVQSLAPNFDITTNPSTAKFFPEIGDQGDISSCTAWATTYYQFTYEINKFRNITTTSSNCYSPTWTYNYINRGANKGTFLSDAYAVLENQGAMLMSDMPYQLEISNYSFEWSTDVNKMLNALQYRISWDTLSTPTDSPSDFDIESIKQRIANGHVAVVHTDASGWTIEKNAGGEEFIVRDATSNDGGHFVAVVGYDDNIEITVNGTTLTGAFKVANSWGEKWGNNGYIWVSYDALNKTSIYDTGWESKYSGTRRSVFTGGEFNFITPFKCSAEFCECLRITTNNPYSIGIRGNRGTYATKVKKVFINSNAIPVSTRYLVFDYGSLGGSFVRSAILSSQWTMKMNSTSASVYNIQARIVDNKNQEIEKFDSVYGTTKNGIYVKTHNVSLAVGRITSYDNNEITNQDIALLQNYLLGKVIFSSLQRKLADYNGDGEVNGIDLAEMRAHIASTKGQTLSLNECLDDLKESVIDELNENNVSFSMFMSGELAINE